MKRTTSRARLVRGGLVAGAGTIATVCCLLASSCAVSGHRHVAGYDLGQRTRPEQLTLLSWNVQKSGHPGLAGDLEQAIHTHDPDILFLQEARPGDEPDRQVGGVLAPAWRAPLSPQGGTGVFTASREDPVASRAVRSRDREFGITVPKAALATQHALPDGRLLLALNVHALNFEHGAPRRFARQMERLRQIMADHEGPIIFAGDFNTWNRARDRHLRELADSLKLREVAAFAGSRKTGDQGLGWWNGLLGIDPTLPLDRIFYRDLTVSSARVLNLDSSDHPPLLVTFQCAPDREDAAEGPVGSG